MVDKARNLIQTLCSLFIEKEWHIGAKKKNHNSHGKGNNPRKRN